MWGIYETKHITNDQKRKYVRSEAEIIKKFTDSHKYKYIRSDLMEKLIKNCRGLKKCNDGINKIQKEKQRKDFRVILGFKENDIYE